MGSLVAPVAGIFSAREERKKSVEEGKQAIDLVLAEASADNAKLAAQIALVKAQNEGSTWKDEYALIVVTAPIIVVVVSGAVEALGLTSPGTTEKLSSGIFLSFESVPEWWSTTFQIGILAALGVGQFQKIVR